VEKIRGKKSRATVPLSLLRRFLIFWELQLAASLASSKAAEAHPVRLVARAHEHLGHVLGATLVLL
jgi:hypothetical protein